ncbi:MAG: hypothetical protein IKY83_01225 [Proteobacteria bacterium]|nr:hypothetical protein [Pseudomonadota bacterium]
MKRLFVCLLGLMLLGGCGFGDRSKDAEADAYRYAETVDQTRHYRPVHVKEPWMIAQTAKRLTLRAGAERIQLGVRYDPDIIVIRKHGMTIGRVTRQEDGSLGAWMEALPDDKLTVSCSVAHRSVIAWKGMQYDYQYDDAHNAWSDRLEVRKLQPKRLYSVALKTSEARMEVCEGEEIESPFSAFGVLLFHEDAIPLALRMGMAWYVTIFQTECAG